MAEGKVSAGKWAFIVNPASGGGAGRAILPQAIDAASQRGIKPAVYHSQAMGDATARARQAIDEGADHIIAIGGDGTMNEIVQVMAGRTDLVFGFISAGTGNDIAPLPGYSERFTPRDYESLFQARTHLIDLGVCNGRYFLNGVGLGFDAHVIVDYNKSTILKGKARYWKAVLKNLFFYRPSNMTITMDGVTLKLPALMTTIGNGRRFGGGFSITYRAMADDGLLDLCQMEDMPPWTRAARLQAVLNKSHIGLPKVRYQNVRSVSIIFDTPQVAQLDGELMTDTAFDISIKPSYLNIIINPEGKPYLANL